MNKMSCVNRLPSERYECPTCEQVFDNEDVQDTWKCPKCGGYISVYAEDVATDTKIVLIRKQAKELELEDLVYLPLNTKSYMVLGINKLRNGKLGFGLKGYTQYKLLPDEPVNCQIGAWW